MNTGHKYDILAIPARYNGTLFRSRLEATWAAFFDELGWAWDYEPLDFSGWTPDFLLKFQRPTLVEVKPTDEQCKEVTKLLESFRSEDKHEILVLGNSIKQIRGSRRDTYEIGQLSQQPFDGLDHTFADAPLYICGYCDRPTITHGDQSWHCRLNGCYDGNAYLTGDGDFQPMWNRAKTSTRFEI